MPERWDKQFSALTDVGLERGLRGLTTDVLVTVTPALLACARGAAARRAWWWSTRSTGRPRSAPRGWSRCCVNAPRADVVALLTPTHRGVAARPARGRWRPRSWSMPEPAARRASRRARCSTPDDRGGRAAGDGEAVHQAGRRPSPTSPTSCPGWRLRILGQGHQRAAPGPRDPQARPLGPGRAARQHDRHAERVGAGQHLRAHLAGRGVPARAAGGDGGRRPVRDLRLRLRSAGDRPARGERPARRARVDRRHVRGAAPARHRRRPAAPAGGRRPRVGGRVGRRRARRPVGGDLPGRHRAPGRTPPRTPPCRRRPRRSHPRRRRTTRPA